MSDVYEECARIAEDHKAEIIAEGTPDAVINAYVDGHVHGYNEAAKAIAEAIRLAAPAREED
jgi:hypothetical protein